MSVEIITPVKKIRPRDVALIAGLVLVLLAVGLFVWPSVLVKKSTKENAPVALSMQIPRTDLAHARQSVIGPAGGTIQVSTGQKVQITLEIPAGALTKPTLIKVLPFVSTGTSSPVGLVLSPGDLRFQKPARLFFSFENSLIRLDAPALFSENTIRRSGTHQVVQIAGEKGTVIPMLVIRPVETKTHLAVELSGGGPYALVTDSARRALYARQGLGLTQSRSATLESAGTLLVLHKSLSKEERAKALAAAQSVLAVKTSTGPELFAALVVASELRATEKTSWIPAAHAAEDINRTFFQSFCSGGSHSFVDMMAISHAAQLLGDTELATDCYVAVKKVVENQAKKVLADPKAELKNILKAREALVLTGLAETSKLDEDLTLKAEKGAQEEVRAVLRQPTASASRVAIVLQRTEVVRVEESLKRELKNRLQTTAPKKLQKPVSTNPVVSASGSYPSGSSSGGVVQSGQEEVVTGAEDVVVGYGLATALGYDPAFSPSFDAWISQLSTNPSAHNFDSGLSDDDEESDQSAYLCLISSMYGLPPSPSCGVQTEEAEEYEDYFSDSIDDGRSDEVLPESEEDISEEASDVDEDGREIDDENDEGSEEEDGEEAPLPPDFNWLTDPSMYLIPHLSPSVGLIDDADGRDSDESEEQEEVNEEDNGDGRAEDNTNLDITDPLLLYGWIGTIGIPGFSPTVVPNDEIESDDQGRSIENEEDVSDTSDEAGEDGRNEDEPALLPPPIVMPFLPGLPGLPPSPPVEAEETLSDEAGDEPVVEEEPVDDGRE